MNIIAQKRLKTAFKATTLLRSRELAGHGVSRVQMAEAVKMGLLERAGCGLYRRPNADITEHYTLAEVGRRIPKGIFCLLSALNFHGLTTQNPHDVWIALGHKAWRPRLDTVGLRVMRYSGAALREGVDNHVIGGVPVKVYNPAKTVVDCFKFRNKVGLDVALEALRETWRARRCTMDELAHYAGICRVEKVMRPYLESLTA